MPSAPKQYITHVALNGDTYEVAVLDPGGATTRIPLPLTRGLRRTHISSQDLANTVALRADAALKEAGYLTVDYWEPVLGRPHSWSNTVIRPTPTAE